MSNVAGKKGKYDGVIFEVQIDGLPKQRFTSIQPAQFDKDGNPPPLYIPMRAKTLGEWHSETIIIGQCEWCGKDASGDPKATPFLCEDCVTHPDRRPTILCSKCGAPFTEIIGVSRKWFRCVPCKREIGR